jgi:hypothetical protein
MSAPKKPLLDMRTPLSLIPKTWLDLIEPHIVRPKDSSCWLWIGPIDRDGEPTLSFTVNGKRSTRRVKRIVADLYWEIDDKDVVHECGVINCLAPFHFYVSDLHWTQEDRERRKKRRGKRIERWGKQRT